MKSALDKLGFKPDMLGWIHNAPAELSSVLLLPSAPPPTGSVSLTLICVKACADVPAGLVAGQSTYERGKALWFIYPKRSGAICTDISRDKGWEALAAVDLLPVTQVSIDDTWSALRFRYRDEIKTLTRKSDLPGKRD